MSGFLGNASGSVIPLDLMVNPISLRKAKIVYNFGLSECNRVNLFEEML